MLHHPVATAPSARQWAIRISANVLLDFRDKPARKTLWSVTTIHAKTGTVSTPMGPTRKFHIGLLFPLIVLPLILFFRVCYFPWFCSPGYVIPPDFVLQIIYSPWFCSPDYVIHLDFNILPDCVTHIVILPLIVWFPSDRSRYPNITTMPFDNSMPSDHCVNHSHELGHKRGWNNKRMNE